jgi:hypothetical protein
VVVVSQDQFGRKDKLNCFLWHSKILFSPDFIKAITYSFKAVFEIVNANRLILALIKITPIIRKVNIIELGSTLLTFSGKSITRAVFNGFHAPAVKVGKRFPLAIVFQKIASCRWAID